MISHKPNTLDKDSYFIPGGYDSIGLLKGFDINNELSKIYEEKITTIKHKNIIKEQEIICEDLSIFLNAWRDNKKTQYQSNSNSDYGSNPGNNNILDDKGKKKLDLLQGFRKNQNGSSSNIGNTSMGNTVSNNILTGKNNYESNDNKTKIDFQKFLGMNPNKSIQGENNGIQHKQILNPGSVLNSIKGKNPENIKVMI